MYFEDFLPAIMFGCLAILLFSGFPVGFVLGGIALAFGFIGYAFDSFSIIEFFNFWPRMWGQGPENLVLVAVPMFIFMGTVLERSGVAEDLLYCLQVLLRRVPGGLALAVTILGTVLAATTGIIGASVVMMSLLALPVMVAQGYNKELATGTIAASGTLGILIPPSVMLVFMADLLNVSVGNLFIAAILPGLILASLYMIYITGLCFAVPRLAPPLALSDVPDGPGALARLVLKSFVPPVFLIVLVLGSIFGGFATPTEASGVGAFGALILAAANRRLTIPALREMTHKAALTVGMIFCLVLPATCFSYVFRSLGGDDLIITAIDALGIGSWGVLFAIMATIFFLGFFFDWLEITLIVLPVFSTVVDKLDFGAHVAGTEQIYWFAIIVAVNLQNSFLTPPFGMALFYLKGTAPPEIRIQHIYRGIVPFVALQLIGLALVMAFPEIALWLPRLLLD